MQEKWILETKNGDFNGLAEQFQISPLVAKCMVNRGIATPEEMRKYLNGTLDDLYDPYLLQDMDKAVSLVKAEREKGTKVAIASDFDCDGIFSAYILWKAFSMIGLDCKIFTPDRVAEGYGLNERIVDEAMAEGRELLVTCDNGIAANEPIHYAREKGMRVLVTDHHEVQEEMPEAVAVIDPKRSDDTYPFDGICGAGVAFKFICALYDAFDVASEHKEELLEYVAIATVADVMELRDENRILVKYGLQALQHTKNIGLQALIEVQGLQDKVITVGHIGFILGPCFNAAGRISTVKDSFDLLMEEDKEQAFKKAKLLKEINESRKEMTEEGARQAFGMLKEERLDSVIVILLPDCHESLVGIIAGRVKERFHHPVIVFTHTEDGMIKGSGRSIESYHMFQELMKCKDLMVRFGGHKMAAGMTLAEKDLEELKKRLNENATLEAEDFRAVVHVDAAMPIGYATERLIQDFSYMEPYGVGNSKPIFAEQHFKILSGKRLGKERTVLKLRIQNDVGNQSDAIYFGHIDDFETFVRTEWGEAELGRMYEGRENKLDVAFTYFPSVNEFQGNKTIQMQIVGYCRIRR